jgi:hypothetical protein
MDISEKEERKVIKLRKYSKKPQNEEINDFVENPPPAPGNVRSLRGRRIPIPQSKREKRTKRKKSKTQSLTRSLSNLQLDQNRPLLLQESETIPTELNQAQNQVQNQILDPIRTANQTQQTPPRKNLTKLDQLYIDPKQVSSYSTDLQRYLREKETLSRHRKIIKKFKRRRTIVNGPYTQIQSDTM